MKKAAVLNQILNKIDRKGYKAYKDIEGTFFFEEENYTLFIDHVQGDPFAAPSKIRIIIAQEKAGFPAESYSNKSREIATRDFIIRMFADAIKRHSKGSRGSGKSGKVSIDSPGQEILERTAAFIDDDEVEIRFTVGLPAFGRKIAGREAKNLFFNELPDIVSESMLYENLEQQALQKHIETNEDAD